MNSIPSISKQNIVKASCIGLPTRCNFKMVTSKWNIYINLKYFPALSCDICICFLSIAKLKEVRIYDIPPKEKFQVPVDCFRVFFFKGIKNGSSKKSKGWLNLNTYSNIYKKKKIHMNYEKALFYPQSYSLKDMI